MAINFGVLKTNVGNRVGDTSTTFATIIGTYLNSRYLDVLKRTNWSVLITDYVLSASADTQDYTLPPSFGKEIYVYDEVGATLLPFMSFDKLAQEYEKELASTGTVEMYSIYDTVDSTAASASRAKKLRLFRIPAASGTYSIPYTVSTTGYSADTDVAIGDFDRAIEFGATADAFMYKRQFAKAQAYEQMYEREIATLAWNQEYQPNQQPMMNVLSLNRNEGI